MNYKDGLSIDEVECQMKILWKKTFGDSDDYINLVFDNYFDEDLVEYEIHDGVVIASMMAVPYSFCANLNDGCCDNKLKSFAYTGIRGLYLCGLATDTYYRSSGIMSRMIERIAVKAYYKGYQFLFLIPADTELVNYYSKRYFINSGYKYIYDFEFVDNGNENNHEYVECTKNNDYENLNCYSDYLLSDDGYNGYLLAEIDTDNLLTSVNSNYLKYLYSYFYYFEKSDFGINILHSYNDFLTVIKENIISNGCIYILYRISKERLSSFVNNSVGNTNDSILNYVSGGVIADDNQRYFFNIDQIQKDELLNWRFEPVAIVFCSNSSKEDALYVQRILCDSEESEERLLCLLKSWNTTDKHIKLVSPTPLCCIENLFESSFKLKSGALMAAGPHEAKIILDGLKHNELVDDSDISTALEVSKSQSAGLTCFPRPVNPLKCLLDKGIAFVSRSVRPMAMVRVLNPAEIEKLVDSCTDTRKYCNFNSLEVNGKSENLHRIPGHVDIEQKFASLINASLLLE